MTKQADYYISAVNHTNDKKNVISTVKRHLVNDDGSFAQAIFVSRTRLEVVSDLKSVTYMTIYAENGQWNLGSKVHHVTENGKSFISTDPNETTKDNLGNLPPF